MVKLSCYTNYAIAFLYMLTGVVTISRGVTINYLFIPFALILLVYGMVWMKFCLITKEPTINYHTYKYLTEDFDKIPFQQGRSVKRFSVLLFTLAVMGLALLTFLWFEQFQSVLAAIKNSYDYPGNNVFNLFLIGIFILFNINNIYYSIAVFRSIGSRKKISSQYIKPRDNLLLLTTFYISFLVLQSEFLSLTDQTNS